MDVDVNALVSQLGQQIGALTVELTATRLQLDTANARVTELEGASLDQVRERDLVSP